MGEATPQGPEGLRTVQGLRALRLHYIFIFQASHSCLSRECPPTRPNRRQLLISHKGLVSVLSMLISYKISFPYQLESRPSEISLGGPAEPILAQAEPYELWRVGTIAKSQ